MKDSVLKELLKEDIFKDPELNKSIDNDNDSPTEIIVQDDKGASKILASAAKVMEAYQNANKWLDSIKETLLIDHGCVFFSNYVHNLAHTMPARFDKFGDILHTMGMKVPYPATSSIESEPSDIPTAFHQIFSILNSIEEALSEFSAQVNKASSIASDELLYDIRLEYSALHQMEKAYSVSNDVMKFDSWVACYISNKDSLLD